MSAGIGLFELLIVVGIGFFGVFFLATLLASWSAQHHRGRRNGGDEFAHDASSDSSWMHSSSAADPPAHTTWFGAGSSHDSSSSHDSGGSCDSGSSGDSGCSGGDSGGGRSSGAD